MNETIAQVLSQAVAFLLFFLILKKFAWGPILGLIDERNQKIEEGFRRAEEAERKSAELRAQYEDRLKTIEAEARERIQQAVAEGRKTAEEINDRARTESEKVIAKAREMAQTEMAKARVELKEDVVRYTLMAAEKLVHERLDDSNHRRLVEEFVTELSARK